MKNKQTKKTPFPLYDTLLDSIADGVFSVDLDFRITSFNKAAEKITGVQRENAIGQPCCYIFKATICEKECALRHTLKTGQPIIDKPIHIIDIKGRKIPISISTAILHTKHGKIYGGVETFRDLSQVEALKKELEGKYSFGDIISRNPKMQSLFRILPEIAISESTVLITGESGTGKELVAEATHSLSNRKGKAFIPVNCGALPDSLLESELFGYKKGAFTDAKIDKPGRFALANNGTLFLDEIGDIPLQTQVKLLRVLEDKVYEPLGAIRPVSSNVRIITATNRDLKQMVDHGTFREDLFYRINVINVELPPLRERMEDIPLLADHFINHYNTLQVKNIKGIADNAMSVLLNYSFPGNIRELKNFIERAFVLCSKGFIELHHLPEHLYAKHLPELDLPYLTLYEMEKRLIMQSLRRNKGNRASTARELGIHRSTLFRKLQEYGLQDEESNPER